MMTTISHAAQQFHKDVLSTRAATTAALYERVVSQFLACLARRDIDPTQADVSQLRIGWAGWYQGDMREAGRAASTERDQLSIVKQFYSYAAMYGPGDFSDTAWEWKIARHCRKVGKQRRALNQEACYTLLARLDRCGTDLAARRDRALFWLLSETGLRISEALSLKIGDIDPAAGLIHLARGKGGKAATLPVNEAALNRLGDYLLSRGLKPGSAAAGRLPLFCRHDKRASGQVLPMSSRSAQQALQDRCAQLIPEFSAFTPHTLRHYFVTRFYKRSKDVDLTRRAARHASIRTTLEIYVHTADDELQAAYNRLFGGGK